MLRSIGDGVEELGLRQSESFAKSCQAKGLHCTLNPFPSVPQRHQTPLLTTPMFPMQICLLVPPSPQNIMPFRTTCTTLTGSPAHGTSLSSSTVNTPTSMPTIAVIPLTDPAVATRHSQNMLGRSGTVCLPGVRAVQVPCQAGEGRTCPSCYHAHHIPAFLPFFTLFTTIGTLHLKLLKVDGAIEEYDRIRSPGAH